MAERILLSNKIPEKNHLPIACEQPGFIIAKTAKNNLASDPCNKIQWYSNLYKNRKDYKRRKLIMKQLFLAFETIISYI